MKTPILGHSYVARSVNAADNRMINLYPETVPEGGKENAFLTRTPGMQYVFATAADTPVRGMWVMGSFLYVVAGLVLYKVDADWNVTSIGAVSGDGPVSMSDNGSQLWIACNPRAYVYTVSSNTLAEVTDPDFPGALMVTYLNGYFIFNQPNTQTFWITSFLDGTSIDPLNFDSATASPDTLVGLIADHGELWLFGAQTIEVWYYTGDVNFPFSRIQGAFNEIGCAAPFSIAKLDNTLFWLGNDARGNGIVYRANGYNGQRVSTHAIEWAIQQYGYIGDAIAYTYQQEGHPFYVLTFPTANKTWVYDVATDGWHERAAFDNGVFYRHRSNCQANFNGKILVGDYLDGNVYEFNTSYYADGDQPLKWLRSWRALPTGQNNLKRTVQHSLQLDCESGTGTIEQISTTPLPVGFTQYYNAKFSLAHTSTALDLVNDNASVIRNSTPYAYSWATARSVSSWARGMKYFEVKYTKKEAGKQCVVGVGNPLFPLTTYIGGVCSASVATGIGYIIDTGNIPGATNRIMYNGDTLLDVDSYGNANEGDTIMVGVICGNVENWFSSSSMGGSVLFGRNGTWFATVPFFQPPVSQPISPNGVDICAYVSLYGNSTTQKLTLVTESALFSYSPPSGYTAWDKSDTEDPNQMDVDYFAAGWGKELVVSSNSVSCVDRITIPMQYSRSLFSASSGKYYFELAIPDPGTPVRSIVKLAFGEGGLMLNDLSGNLGGAGEKCDFVVLNSKLVNGVKYDPTAKTYLGSANQSNVTVKYNFQDTGGVPNSQRFMVAIDYDAGKVWTGVDNVWNGNPDTGHNPVWEFTPNNNLYVHIGMSNEIPINPCTTYVYFNTPDLMFAPPKGFTVYNSPGVSTSVESSPSKIKLRWSDDAGHTWSNYHQRNMGELGQYDKRVIWRRLGGTQKLRDRVYEITGSDPVKITIMGAELDVSGTNS